MADINAIAQSFTEFYYSTFDSDRNQLGPLYVRLEARLSVNFILISFAIDYRGLTPC